MAQVEAKKERRQRSRARGVRERESSLTLILIATTRSVRGDRQRSELFGGATECTLSTHREEILPAKSRR